MAPTWLYWPSRTLWTPDNLSGTFGWWKADAGITLSGSDITDWADQGSAGVDVTTGSSGTYPTILADELNGIDVIRFTAGGKYMQASANLLANASTGYVIASVARMITDPGTGRADIVGVVSGVNTNNFLVAMDFDRTADKSAQIMRREGADTATIITSSANYSFNTWYVRSGTWDYPSGDVHQYVDGAEDPTGGGTHGNTGSATEANDGVLKINGFLTGFGMDIGEIVVVKSSSSDTEREKLEGYLAHRWGLTANLPSGHPYKNSPPYV